VVLGFQQLELQLQSQLLEEQVTHDRGRMAKALPESRKGVAKLEVAELLCVAQVQQG
jgi:hypothetical protein